ncbi:hypothetical protein SDJN02_05328, partial [Cucurbita argyrosperma subsp. argyrosperma]
MLAEERRTTNSYIIEIGSDNREGKNKAVAHDGVIAQEKENQLVLSLRPVGFSHLLRILLSLRSSERRRGTLHLKRNPIDLKRCSNQAK